MEQHIAVKALPRKGNKHGRTTAITVAVLMVALIALPGVALAQTSGSSALDGITNFMKMIVNLLIFEWGKYIAILTLAFNAFRLKGGKISWMDFGGWLAGCLVLFFAPDIVDMLMSNSKGRV